jgi:checkpoint serine/threonine-protein kinase
MPLVRPTSADAGKLQLKKDEFRAKLSTAINEEDDPLAVYDQFVQWTLKTYGENNPNSGLLELLEQATREFRDDPLYKTDLRYLKLWSLYARQVERSGAIAIYAYLVSNEIGTSYSVLYEEYATLLDADGR